MDTFEINKIVACILIVALIFIGLANLGEILYEVEKPEIAHYQVEGLGDSVATTPETHEDTSTPIEVEDSIFTLLASADLSKGAKVFKKCSQCHVVEKDGANKIGPALWDIVNKAIGSKEDFKYSNALASYEGKWTYEELNGFLYKPKEYINGTKMNFAGLKKQQDRADLILYLRDLSDNPFPLP